MKTKVVEMPIRTFTKICPACGLEFETEVQQRKYCSDECSAEFRERTYVLSPGQLSAIKMLKAELVMMIEKELRKIYPDAYDKTITDKASSIVRNEHIRRKYETVRELGLNRNEALLILKRSYPYLQKRTLINIIYN